MSFKARALAHIVATTPLLALALYPPYLCGTPSPTIFCPNLSKKLSSYILHHMADFTLDPLSLPYGMLISRILETNHVCLSDVPPFIVEQCYNSRAFGSMGYTLLNDSWALKYEPPLGLAHESLVDNSPSNRDPSILPDSKLVEELISKISSMDARFEAQQNLLISTHYKFDAINETTKETGTDVTKIKLQLIQIVKEAIKVSQKIQANLMSCLSLSLLCLKI